MVLTALYPVIPVIPLVLGLTLMRERLNAEVVGLGLAAPAVVLVAVA